MAAALTAVRDERRVAAALVLVALVTAAIVRASAAPAAREFFGFGFPDLEASLGEMLSILVNNARLLAGILLAAAFAQLAPRTGPLTAATLPARVTLTVCEGVLVLLALGHALVVGAGVGAYGSRMIASLLPHAPLELAAYSLALGALVRGHRRELTRPRAVATGAAGLGLLVIGAVLETAASPVS